MTQAFLEPTIIDNNNVHLFLKAISKKGIEKVKKADEERKKRKKELDKILNNRISIKEIMEKYIDE
jgi:hypothetical protein